MVYPAGRGKNAPDPAELSPRPCTAFADMLSPRVSSLFPLQLCRLFSPSTLPVGEMGDTGDGEWAVDMTTELSDSRDWDELSRECDGGWDIVAMSPSDLSPVKGHVAVHFSIDESFPSDAELSSTS